MRSDREEISFEKPKLIAMIARNRFARGRISRRETRDNDQSREQTTDHRAIVTNNVGSSRAFARAEAIGSIASFVCELHSREKRFERGLIRVLAVRRRLVSIRVVEAALDRRRAHARLARKELCERAIEKE
jgi:hypothetical protein